MPINHFLKALSSQNFLHSHPSPTTAPPNKKRSFHLNRTLKILIAVGIVVVLLFSTLAFIPKSTPNAKPPVNETSPTSTATGQPTATQTPASTPWNPRGISSNPQPTPSPSKKAPGVIASAKEMNSTVWMAIAKNAWNYFQPGVGVDHLTGLPYANGIDFKAFTDWDLGSYIQAVINAQKIGLIGTDGVWGSQVRLEKVLNFLENRELNSSTPYNYPYWFYDATDRTNYKVLSDTATSLVDGADTGRLLLALYNLKNYNSSLFATRVDNLVYNNNHNRTDYTSILPSMSQTSNSIYAYYIQSGFACFWPDQIRPVTRSILANILNSTTVTDPQTGFSLPNAPLCNEPLLSSVFEINNGDGQKLMALTHEVYLAHEAYTDKTQNFLAPSEGQTPNNGWLYGWVVGPNGKFWQTSNSGQNIFYDFATVSPILYTKVAFSFLALENTTFAKNLSVWIENAIPEPDKGYYDGADWNLGIVWARSTNTGCLVLDAAYYALSKA